MLGRFPARRPEMQQTLPAEAQTQLKAAGSLKAERDPPEMSGRRNIGFPQRMG